MNKLNNIPKSLKDEARKWWKKIEKGGEVTFEITGIKFDKHLNRHIMPRRVGIPEMCRIKDPETGEDIDIAYVTSEKPTGPDSQKDTQVNLGKIYFLQDDKGRITFRKNNMDWNKFLYLFLSNFNKSNIGKPWHNEPDLINPYKYYLVDSESDAENKINFIKKRNEAQDMVDTMGKTELRALAKGLFPDHEKLTENEIAEKLYMKAEVNPDYILRINENVDIRLKAYINDFEKAGLIHKNIRQKKWEYRDTGDFICTIKPGITPEESLKNYFLTDDGKEVMNSLKSALPENKKEDAVLEGSEGEKPKSKGNTNQSKKAK